MTHSTHSDLQACHSQTAIRNNHRTGRKTDPLRDAKSCTVPLGRHPRSAKRHLRMPLLSQPVVEACLKVPSWMWIAEGRNRAVARDAFADVLPADVLHRRSKGTFTNYSGAVYRRNKSRLREYLLTGQLAKHGLLDIDALRQFFDRGLGQQDDTFMRIFDLCAVENWVRHQR